MAIVKAITPEEVSARKLEKQVVNMDLLNKATTMINGRLNLLERGSELDFSFVREGFNLDILDALAARFLSVGWEVEVYRNASVDFGVLISWK
jgi:hypothetical protein